MHQHAYLNQQPLFSSHFKDLKNTNGCKFADNLALQEINNKKDQMPQRLD